MLAEHAARTSLNMHAIWYVIFVNGLIIGLPNPAWATEDFGSPNQPFRMCVRNNFQRFVAQMEYSRP